MSKELENKICKAIEEILEIEKTKRIQMFNCYDTAGDYKEYLLKEDGIEVLYAPGYRYVEVIGLADKDYQKIFKKYGY
jgi:site-specific recombinase XerD